MSKLHEYIVVVEVYKNYYIEAKNEKDAKEQALKLAESEISECESIGSVEVNKNC